MAQGAEDKDVVIQKLREFDRLAISLEVPLAERLGILNVSEQVYSTLRNGGWPSEEAVRPEMERRLSYALPLMRRLASTAPGRGGAKSTPPIRQVA